MTLHRVRVDLSHVVTSVVGLGALDDPFVRIAMSQNETTDIENKIAFRNGRTSSNCAIAIVVVLYQLLL